ncbi:hypothetical protein VRK_20710 [Vibrio sp. MEBiC08052]|nr:hypothetical protein VRK_20710 [Vibrio sp. MEBiC08052]
MFVFNPSRQQLPDGTGGKPNREIAAVTANSKKFEVPIIQAC